MEVRTESKICTNSTLCIVNVSATINFMSGNYTYEKQNSDFVDDDKATRPKRENEFIIFALFFIWLTVNKSIFFSFDDTHVYTQWCVPVHNLFTPYFVYFCFFFLFFFISVLHIEFNIDGSLCVHLAYTHTHITKTVIHYSHLMEIYIWGEFYSISFCVCCSHLQHQQRIGRKRTEKEGTIIIN